MLRHTRLSRMKHAAALTVLVAATAAILLGDCTAAAALRPRGTPAQASAVAAAREPAGSPAATARHDAAISRMLARHLGAAGGAAAEPSGARDRLHRPTALTARGALLVTTLAAVAAIALLSLAIVVGSQRQEARRRAARRAAQPATGARRSLAG